MIGIKLKNRRKESRILKRKKDTRRKYIRYSIFAIACYISFLLWTLPASVAISFIKDNPQLKNKIQLSIVNGTLWNGSAASAQIAGINLGALHWNLKVLPLLIGKVKVYISFNNKGLSSSKISGSGNIAVSSSGEISVDDFTAAVTADALAPLMYGLPARFSGDLNLHINELSLVKGKRINIKSRIVVSHAGLVSPQRIEYGDILIQVSPKQTGSQITLADQGGPLILDGSIKIKGNGVYNVNLGMGARNSASDDLVKGLRFLGSRDATGKYRYRTNGKLNNW